MPDRKVMRDISLNEKVAVSVPAYVWIGFIAAWRTSDWNNGEAGAVVEAAQRAMMDPIWIKEQEAAAQEAQDAHNAIFHSITTGRPPEPPERIPDE